MLTGNKNHGPMGRAATVLVVDDEANVGELIARWLKVEGYACVRVSSAEAAWAQFQARNFDLITLDIQLASGQPNATAGSSGIDLLRWINAADPDISIIMLTSAGDSQTAIEALTCGACAYLVKPVAREQLIVHARRAIERRQLFLEKRDYTQKLEERVRAQTVAIRQAHEDTIVRLIWASLWHDEETGLHIKRTGMLSECLARAAGWSAEDVEQIRLAAPMHDIGKIGIPDAILRKPGTLTVDEFEIMKRHTVIGSHMLAGSNVPMLKMAKDIALNHHERWDGHGYPAGLIGEGIPESARIVAIVDTFDALCHDRVYRRALPENEVLDIMRRGSATHFDPDLLALFFDNLDVMSRITFEEGGGDPKLDCVAQSFVPTSAEPFEAYAAYVNS